jgi:carbon-monoxide dehydrogenase medium subunit
MKLPRFEYHAPATAAEAVRLLAAHSGEAKILAGGQTLLPAMAFRLAQPAVVVDIRNVRTLSDIAIDERGVVLGARVRWRDIEDSRALARAHPLLVEAIGHVAHYQVRNRGTVGGSLAHADPAAEMPCVAATCDAEVRLLSPRGERRVSAGEFFVGPLTTALAEDEMIIDVTLPAWPAERRWAFIEFSRRPGDFALAGVALYYDPDREGLARNVHIGVIGACYYAQRVSNAELALEGHGITPDSISRAAAAASEAVDAPDDLHASAEYRKALVGTLLERALEQAAARPRVCS